MDTLTPEQRSERMSRVRGRDTKPEMKVRRLVRSLGYGYRLHVRDLPGTPDLVFPGRRAVIFIHGCYWHRHDCPSGRRIPKSKLDFWLPKLSGNAGRDAAKVAALEAEGWRVLVIWECQIRDTEGLSASIQLFLGSTRR